MFKKLFIITFFFAFWFNFVANSQQQDLVTNIGFYGGLGLNFHSTFEPDQKSELGIGPFIGIIGNFPIDNTFSISGRIGYYNLNGSLFRDENEFLRYRVNAKLDYIEISPILQIHNVFDNPLYFLAGLEFGAPMSVKYDFVTKTPTGENTQPDIDVVDKVSRLAIAAGVGYTFQLSDNIFLSPEASFRLPLTTVSSNSSYDKWNVSQLRLGINLTYSLTKYEEPIQPVENKVLNIGQPELSYYDEKMIPRPLNKINVEEVQYSELFPLLPYVFFPEGKAVPDESVQSLGAQNMAGEFTIETLTPDAFKINTYNLDIIGKRMKENPTAVVTITGTVSSKELKSDKGLAKQRADFAKNYLIANYGITDNRINVVAGGLPSKPSNKNDVEGDAENRRAEISSNNFEILKPIVLFGNKERVTNPNLINFKVPVNSNDEVTNWKLIYKQSGEELEVLEGNSLPIESTWQIKPNQLASSSVPVDYYLTVQTASGISRSINGSIPSDYFSFSRKKSENLPDKTISKFSLVLFDFDSPNVSDIDKQVLDKNVIPAIGPNSTVQIYGYTDRIGDFEYNKNLATRRADAVKNYLSSKLKNVKFETYGVGESVQIFDNNKTLGRQLSRTVQIYVVTPKK